MGKFIIIIILIFAVPLNAHLLQDNGWSDELEDSSKNGENYLINIQRHNLTKIESNYHLFKSTKIKFRYFPILDRKIPQEGENETHCLENSSEDFPSDIFTMEQKRNGAIILHFVLGIYCFTLLAIVCNDYFLPTVDIICETLHLSQDVAAATFMAIATSAPEFFVNIVGTFVTESDIGVGTIVGSAMFNTLGVAAIGGIVAKDYIQIDWWPITRDSVIYVISVIMLVIMAEDEKIEWFEALILVCFYLAYFLIMWQNQNIYKLVVKLTYIFQCSESIQYSNSENAVSSSNISTVIKKENNEQNNLKIQIEADLDKEETSEELSLWHLPSTGGKLIKVWWFYSWPIRFVLKYTIPSCHERHCLFPLTFTMCIIWIAINSYVISWMISVIGATFKIPDFIMGITFLAAGGCLPEAISIAIVVRKGQGGMGVSNSLGANTLNILLSLGLPWFIKTMVGWDKGQNYIEMDSDSLFYTVLGLIVAVLVLYAIMALSGYKLCKKTGYTLIFFYVIFLATAISLEMFLYYDGKLFPCEM